MPYGARDGVGVCAYVPRVTQPSDCQYDVTADDISAIGPSMTSYIADESGVWGRQGGREVSVYALSTSRNVKVLD